MSFKDEYISGIVRNIKERNFPDDYLQDLNDFIEVKIIPGKELFMYRKDELTNLVIDGQSLPFDDPYIAKYYYFCSLQRKENAKVPDKQAVRRMIKKFERDLDEDRNLAYSILNGLTDDEKKSIMIELGNLSPYFFLLFYDTIMN